MIIGLPLTGQSFIYSYIDPCTKQSKSIVADMSAPIVISYYGQVKTFTYQELNDGTFDSWINDIYIKYQTTSPCQGVLTTTTTTTSSNQVSNIIGNVTNLLSLDLSSLTSGVTGGVGSNVGGTTSSGTTGITKTKKDGNTNNNNSGGNSDGSGSSSSEGTGQTGQNGGNPPENQGGNGSSGQGGGVDGNNNSNNNNNSSGSNSNSGGGDNNNGTQTKEETPSEKTEQQTEVNNSQNNGTAKATSKAKAEVQKPAILVTGDIVGVQTKSDGAQDARGTMSFTRVKGDGTASIGFSADYMVNAKIGNFSAVRSWIGVNKKGHKHINVASASLGVLPNSLTSNALFVRVNSLKNFTALYGAAGTYGQLYKEELISTIAIAGFMYKGKLAKAVDATIIMAGIYSPYSKFYTESIFESKPIVIPFLNLNYKLTKTFGVGLTAGGTYIAGQDILNYQVLCGAKLLL
jgi:hypothetical protein